MALVVTLGLLLGSPLPLAAQPAAPRPRDPLMTLMLSQPSIDVNSPVSATVVFEPARLRPGESAQYRVTLNALEASIEWPDRLPVTAGVELRPGGRGQMLQVEIAQEKAEYTLREGDRLVIHHEAEEIVLTREHPVATRRISPR